MPKVFFCPEINFEHFARALSPNLPKNIIFKTFKNDNISFFLSRLLHLQFGTYRRDRSVIHSHKTHVHGEQTAAARNYLVSSIRLPGVLGYRDKRTYQQRCMHDSVDFRRFIPPGMTG